MPLRKVLLLLALAACTGTPACSDTAPDPDEIVSLQPEIVDGCPRNYGCQPDNPWGEFICTQVCVEGGYCEPYSAYEEEWCAVHPGGLYHGLFPCDTRGNPTWQKRCLPGWRP